MTTPVYIEGPVTVAITADPDRMRAMAEAEATMFAEDHDLTRVGDASFTLEVPQLAGMQLAREDEHGDLIPIDHVLRVEFHVEDVPTFDGWPRPAHWDETQPICADCAANLPHDHDREKP